MFPRLVKSESKAEGRRAGRAKKSDDIFVIRITLLGSKPPIWRRVAVPAGMTLAKLHDVIQIVMGWSDCHLHQFVTPDRRRYGTRDPELDLDWDADVIDERQTRLRDVVRLPKQRFLYEYDFGDSWEHRLELERTVAPEPGVRYPVCLAGKRACPPEDCGGVWGYTALLEAIRDPQHERHEELLEWIDGELDPEIFDLEEINALLRKLR